MKVKSEFSGKLRPGGTVYKLVGIPPIWWEQSVLLAGIGLSWLYQKMVESNPNRLSMFRRACLWIQTVVVHEMWIKFPWQSSLLFRHFYALWIQWNIMLPASRQNYLLQETNDCAMKDCSSVQFTCSVVLLSSPCLLTPPKQCGVVFTFMFFFQNTLLCPCIDYLWTLSTYLVRKLTQRTSSIGFGYEIFNDTIHCLFVYTSARAS